MVELSRVALHRRLDLAKRRRPGKLGVKQRHELAFGAQLTNPSIGPVFFHQIIEGGPRDMLQNAVEDAIVVTHGPGPFSCPNHRQVFENE